MKFFSPVMCRKMHMLGQSGYNKAYIHGNSIKCIVFGEIAMKPQQLSLQRAAAPDITSNCFEVPTTGPSKHNYANLTKPSPQIWGDYGQEVFSTPAADICLLH